MELRELLLLPAHMYRKVMMFKESAEEFDYYVVAAYTDHIQMGAPTSEIHIITSFSSYERDVPKMQSRVDELSDYIMASRRLIGLDVDEFAKQGIE